MFTLIVRQAGVEIDRVPGFASIANLIAYAHNVGYRKSAGYKISLR